MLRSIRLINVPYRSLTTWFSTPKMSTTKIDLINRIPIDRDLTEFNEFRKIPYRDGKFRYMNPERTPRSVFLETVSDKEFSQVKKNVQAALANYPDDVIEDMSSRYGIRIVTYDMIGPSLWQGDYNNGFLKDHKSIFLPRSQCMKVGDAKVYLGERLIELVDAHNRNESILGENKDVRDKRLETVGFLVNPKNRLYVDIDQILAENNMHHVLEMTMKANLNLGVHFVDLYSEASRYIERRRRWHAILGFGKTVGDKLEKHGIVKKDSLTSWSNIVKGNPLIDRWLLILLGGGVSLGGITALIKRAKKRVSEGVDKAKDMVVRN